MKKRWSRAAPRGALVVAALAAASTHAAGARPSATSPLATPSHTYVAVSVATVWTSPSAPRRIDLPALRNPAAIRTWTRSLDTHARRGLIGRIETQALLGERVRVLARRGAWVRVAVTDQPTPKDRRGYPGWVPGVQLVRSARFDRLAAGPMAVVTRKTAWLRGPTRRVEVGYGTRLPLVRSAGLEVVVALPSGGKGRLARSAVELDRSPGPRRDATRAAIVAAARRFLGVRYLWGGTSAFGFDCSGLIHLVYRAHGLVIPRDADAQALKGTPVSRARVRPGDLLFYGRPHVHHVALFAGAGRMIEAPGSASWVRLVPVRSHDYAGARRYLP